MKLKYYLRGLGIGMIVTALILGISFSNRQDQTSQIMTDDQIRERAAELGMVDSSELTLAALQNSAKQPTEGTPEETTQTQEQNNIEAEPETTVPAETQATAEPETTQEPEATAEPEPEKTAAPETTAEQEVTEAPQRTQTASITIQRGDDSGSASRRLYEAGLVENAKAFDNYLCNNGYSRSINPGTYEIAPGTSEEEIAKIITGKH
ncbi:hypothetical protein [Waltera sp.]|jgi:FtsZ-interacting cell division protein ZipA|uniref:hypothetical protein n=1 Tax=Waltera sp. TaxID=2815806 RepID=UPI003AB63DE3